MSSNNEPKVIKKPTIDAYLPCDFGRLLADFTYKNSIIFLFYCCIKIKINVEFKLITSP